VVEGGRPTLLITDGGRPRVDAPPIDALDTCREPSLDGEEVLDAVPGVGRGGVEGPALAFGRAAV
jgi:hypothetical protein